ncbi:hypothetical protein [Scytonema millei]|uniref:Uncharacterized protein n=1 Tax=Scytonema millei VB511283 TaxID=1245923 RepID=A0A9X5I7H9_9CYAN|nr:hypothetical protein [Scytonema millei]NHC37890.1 hypothetical protein [Scytonema millei VB511283]
MKSLGFISPLLACANCLGSWESVAMAVESLFVGGAARFWRLGDRLSQAQSARINDNFGYGSIGLHSSEPLTQLDSGRYRYKTVPSSG